jgi:hypothetical protein
VQQLANEHIIQVRLPGHFVGAGEPNLKEWQLSHNPCPQSQPLRWRGADRIGVEAVQLGIGEPYRGRLANRRLMT